MNLNWWKDINFSPPETSRRWKIRNAVAEIQTRYWDIITSSTKENEPLVSYCDIEKLMRFYWAITRGTEMMSQPDYEFSVPNLKKIVFPAIRRSECHSFQKSFWRLKLIMTDDNKNHAFVYALDRQDVYMLTCSDGYIVIYLLTASKSLFGQRLQECELEEFYVE